MVKLRVNGQEQSFDGDPSMPLLWYLRDELGLTGTKYGCGVALCGACTVHVDGQATRACITAVNDVSPSKVVVGGRADGNTAHDATLADQRATAVMQALTQQGVPASKLEKEGKALH